MNSAYNVLFALRRVELKPDVRRFKTALKQFVPPMKVGIKDKVRIRLKFHQLWWTKKGTMKRQDVHNMVKIVVDGTCESLGFDDSQVWEVVAEKVEATDAKIEGEVEVISGEDAEVKVHNKLDGQS